MTNRKETNKFGVPQEIGKPEIKPITKEEIEGMSYEDTIEYRVFKKHCSKCGNDYDMSVPKWWFDPKSTLPADQNRDIIIESIHKNECGHCVQQEKINK